MTARHRALLAFGAALVLGVACSGAPIPRPVPSESSEAPSRDASAARGARSDECASRPGEPAPKPLRTSYTGVAAAARCEREVFSIMGGVTHFLGVQCEYCHVPGDYAAMTKRKRVANWMARELIPSLRHRTGKDVWCDDCHASNPDDDGKGTAKLLGDPRNRGRAIEWMTVHLVDNFDDHAGEPLVCSTCHGGRLGSADFRPAVIGTDLAPVRADAAPSDAAPSDAAPSDAGRHEEERADAPRSDVAAPLDAGAADAAVR